MKTEVTEQGLLIPKRLLEGIEEVEIRKENGVILVVPLHRKDPIFQLGQDPIDDDVTDASTQHDRYIYQR
jgi:hypothetical protein